MRLRWVVVGVLLLLVAGLAAALMFANRLIDANRGRIVAAAQSAIGRPVRIGSIGARLFGRPAVRLTDFSIADDPAFGTEPFLSTREATVLLKFWPLLQGRLEIGRIELREPVVRLVRAADGRMNYATLAPAAPPAATETGGSPPAAGSASGGGGLAWAVGLFDIDDGAVDFIDRSVAPPRTTSARKIALRATDISLDEAMNFSFRAAVGSPSENVELSGQVGPLASREGVAFSVQGNVGPFLFEQMAPTRFEDIEARGRLRPQSLDLDEVKLHAFGGDVSGQGTAPLTERGPFSFNGKGAGIDLRQLLPVVYPQAKEEVDGRAAVDVDLQGVGRSEEALRSSLRGDISLTVRDGVLRRFNLPGEVMKKITSLPGLAQLVARGVKPKYAAVLNRQDTKFDSFDLRLRLIPGGVQVETCKLEGEDFGATAGGTVGLGGQADLQGEVVLSKRFSDDVAADVKEARLLFNQGGQIAVPFRYRGEIGKAKPEADVERLATSVLGAQGGALVNELQRKLNSLFKH